MSTVDNRIVSMQFDNASFESKLGETMKSLDALKKSLDFAESKRNLGDLENAGKNFNMGNMSTTIEGISGKFLALATVGVTALATITSKAISSGAQFVNAFSFKPIMDGFHEFETNMNSIQTILANTESKGSTLADVNKALQELNTYSDKTIYNFSEMARNIGTFTAAGVDLNTSVQSIKGIANLAAISGSSSEQASTAMYQLSQAIATGSVKLMDWNSVVNAGMGGEVFQKALFESGKAMKTLTNVPAGQTFEEWKKAGNSFRDSLQDGWITSKVLTSTLKTFTGDLTEAQIMAMGYTKKQAAELLKLGKTGQKAATQVKTLSQLLGTVKEAVGSGWTQTFQIVFGDFQESIDLFTSINDVIGKFVGASADARNELLKGWKDLGGRTMLIQGFENAFTSLGKVIGAIKEAFREIFPPTTSKDLIDMTQAFKDFTEALKPSPGTLENIKTLFEGLFSVLSIGWTVIKETASLIANLVKEILPGGGSALSFGAGLGSILTKAKEILVDGGAIHAFFQKINDFLSAGIGFIRDIIGWVVQFFATVTNSKEVQAVADRLVDRFDQLKTSSEALSGIWDRLSGALNVVKDTLADVGNYIINWFGDLGDRLAAALEPSDFDGVVSVINLGLLGGIAIMLRKFFNEGWKNLGGGKKTLETIQGMLEGVTGTLKAMQTQLKAKALLSIAIAMGVLTASLVALSLINPVALSAALTAMGVAFAQLIGTMKFLDLMNKSMFTGGKLITMAAALVIVAGAMATLAIAIRLLASLDAAELAKGLAGVAGGLTVLVTAAKFMSTNARGLIAGGLAMMAMATAMNILALAVKSFAEMSWSDMAKGFAGVGAGLVILALAMRLMPGPSILITGVALIAVATALRILAEAVQVFGGLGLGDLVKGLLGVGGGLAIIGLAMGLMPLTLPLTAGGLVLVGIALISIAQAVKMIGENTLGQLAKGLGGLAIALGIIALAVNAMTGALGGAAALLIVSGALLVLAHVLKVIGSLKLSELAMALGGIAAVFIVLGLAALALAPITPALLALGIAMGVVGAAFALFGGAVWLVANAIVALASVSEIGIKTAIKSFELMAKALPKVIIAIIVGVIESVGDILQAGTVLIKVLGVLLGKLLDTIIELVPKIAKALIVIIVAALALLRTIIPDLIRTGAELLWNLLVGIRNNIGWITQLSVDILVRFAESLTANAEKLVNAAVNLMLAFTQAIADRAGDIAGAGLNMLLAFIGGMVSNINKIVETVGTLIASFITAISNSVQRIVDAGANLIVKFIEGIANNMTKVVTAGTDAAIAFINAIGDNAVKFANAAADALEDFLNGMAEAIRTHSKELREAGINVVEAIADGMTFGLAGKAKDVTDGAVDLAGKAVGGVLHFIGAKSPSKLFKEIGGYMAAGMALGLDKDKLAENSAVAQAERIVEAFSKTLGDNPDMLIGLDANPVITPVLDLTKVKAGATALDNLMSMPAITPDVSMAQARMISTTTDLTGGDDKTPAYTGPSEVKFEQNIFSPEALSTNDIYRNTKSQIALAKEELKI